MSVMPPKRQPGYQKPSDDTTKLSVDIEKGTSDSVTPRVGDSVDNEDHPDFPLANRVRRAEKKVRCLKWVVCILCCIFLVNISFNVYEAYHMYKMEHRYDHLLKSPDEMMQKNTEPKNESVGRRALRVTFHSHHKTCDDYKYGCCDIFYDCKLNDDKSTVIPKTIHFSPYVGLGTVKENEEGTNCPSLRELVQKHNSHYDTNYSREDNYFGKCEQLEVHCDHAMRNKYMKNNDNDLITKEYVKHPDVYMDVNRVDFNGYGGICPSKEKLMYEWVRSYPPDYDPTWYWYHYFFLGIGICFAGCWVMATCSSNR